MNTPNQNRFECETIAGWEFTCLYLVGHNLARAEFDAYFLRGGRVKVAQADFGDLPLVLESDQVMKSRQVSWIVIILPMELSGARRSSQRKR